MHIRKKIILLLVVLSALLFLNAPAFAAAKKPGIAYRTHVQKIGTQRLVHNGQMSGTSGRSLRVEALWAQLENADGTLTYQVHVQHKGWMNPVRSGQMAGTMHKSLRVEALRVRLSGKVAASYDVVYRVHVQKIGWLAWTRNGATAGTTAKGLRVEALQLELVPKGAAPSDPLKKASASSKAYLSKGVIYQAHVQNIGWQKKVCDGATAGTTGKNLRVEALKLSLGAQDYLGHSGTIKYRAAVQNSGWQGWKTSGQTAGTTGKKRYIEAVQIKLSGDIANYYDVYYRTHVQSYGWLGWTKNGASAGTQNLKKRVEALQVRLVAKNGAAPGTTRNAFIAYKVLAGSNGVDVSEHNKSINWTKLKKTGVRFAMLRVGWGHTGNGAIDKQFYNYYQNATAAGIPVGVYLYSYADDADESVQEANYALAILNGRHLDLPVCIDLEDAKTTGTHTKAEITAMAKAFCERVKKAGYTPMIYANRDWLQNKVNYSQIKQYRIWYAQYPYASASKKTLYSSWSTAIKPAYDNHIDIWQFTSTGRLNGISGDVDLDKTYAPF